MTKGKRYELLMRASDFIRPLLEEVCPACKAADPVICEVVDGIYTHINTGDCAGSPIRQLLSHIDDIRHQFANEFNEDESPRFHWVPTHPKAR